MPVPVPVASDSSGPITPPERMLLAPGTIGSTGIGSFKLVDVVRMAPLGSAAAWKLLDERDPLALLLLPPDAFGAAVRICGWSPFSSATATGSARTLVAAVKLTLYVAQPSSWPEVFRCAYT